MTFGAKETHHWAPIQDVWVWLAKCVIKPGDLVIDVGCGRMPFPRANIGVDRLNRPSLEYAWNQVKQTKWRNQTVECEFHREPLPFKDKEVDFVYCRHLLEDMCYPFPLLKEMQRVGKAGYIETPSPIAELVRGTDGYNNSELWRGYYHHRFFVWVRDNTLTFLSKFPIIEHFPYNEELLEDQLRKGPEFWNTYYLWKDEIHFKHLEEPFDFKLDEEYQAMLWQAAEESMRSTSAFCDMVNESVKHAA